MHTVFANFPRMGNGGRTFARTFVQPSQRTEPGGMDEYQMLQLLDEGVTKRGVSDRKMRSFPIRPVERLPKFEKSDVPTFLLQLCSFALKTFRVSETLPVSPLLLTLRRLYLFAGGSWAARSATFASASTRRLTRPWSCLATMPTTRTAFAAGSARTARAPFAASRSRPEPLPFLCHFRPTVADRRHAASTARVGADSRWRHGPRHKDCASSACQAGLLVLPMRLRRHCRHAVRSANPRSFA